MADPTATSDPFIMVAPNGAYKGKQDHPALPIAIDEIVEEAVCCHKAGAHGIHAHVRDADGEHALDAALYRELIEELQHQAPGLLVQITTEAVNRFSVEQQIDVVKKVLPQAASVALRELLRCSDMDVLKKFYHWASEREIRIQHILYSDEDLASLDDLMQQAVVPPQLSDTLFVLGRYQKQQQSTADDLLPYLRAREASRHLTDNTFMVCAFGQQETDCLLAAAAVGGDCRIGFENNLFQENGELAPNNCARVRSLRARLASS